LRERGTGFITEYKRTEELKLFGNGVCLRWGNVGARLNKEKLKTGYLVYVEDGYVTAVEGQEGDKNPAFL